MALDAWDGSFAQRHLRASRRRRWAAQGAARAVQEALDTLDASFAVPWLRVWVAARDTLLEVEAERFLSRRAKRLGVTVSEAALMPSPPGSGRDRKSVV